jgi:hypothetical protein
MTKSMNTSRHILVFLAALLMNCCSRAADEVANLSITAKTEVQLIRTSSHAQLPEYNRRLVLRDDGKEIAKWHIFPDTGGTQRMNVYLASDGRIFLQDRVSSYQLTFDPVKLEDAETEKVVGKYLGCFDLDVQKVWTFLSPDKAGEIKLGID